MACTAISDIVVRESGRFGPEIYNRIFPTSPLVGLVKRGMFPKGMGSTISNLTYERSAPLDAVPEWAAISVSDGALGGSCLPTSTTVGIGSTTRSYSLYRRVLQGPDFCAVDLQFPFQLRKQLESITSILTGYTRDEWEIRYRHDYVLALENNKTICNAAASTGASTASTLFNGISALCPSSYLTQGYLNRAKNVLLRDGAIFSALGKENGSAVLTLLCSAETSDRLIFDNADIRQDLRWGKPSELLAPYGVERSYRGFYHLIDPFPMRFTCSGGVYTEVAAFSTTAATKGNKSIVNPSYLAAPFEASLIFDPEVFHSLIPEPSITNPAPGYQFDPQSFLGDWQVKNIPDRVCNPDGTILFHRGTLAEAPEPVHPERGWAFVHQRCDVALNGAACS